MDKREVKAKEVVADIRAGIDDVGLMNKYKLTPRGLDSLFGKLLTAGLISRRDWTARKARMEETVELVEIEAALPSQSSGHRIHQRANRCSFSGKVEGVDILDYVQWLLMDGKQTVLIVLPHHNAPCRLFLDRGKVVHAVAGEAEGEEAFYRMAQYISGEFVHLPWTEPENITIESEPTSLLFEAARRRDEADSNLPLVAKVGGKSG
ncbi:MAG: DUF4388 domain-containing protein [Thermodesulfobacteriota bacterium]